MRKLLRSLAYLWPLPYTLLGIAVGLSLGARFQWREGVIEIHGPAVARILSRLPIPALAMTLGHVVLGCDLAALAKTRRHERVHVRQYERWGIAFVPAYLGVAIILYLRGGDGYHENPFEIEAYQADRDTKDETRGRSH